MIRDALPSYACRRRHGLSISTAQSEAAVNQLVSRCMVKEQQMRWSLEGVQRLLDVRAEVLNATLVPLTELESQAPAPRTMRPSKGGCAATVGQHRFPLTAPVHRLRVPESVRRGRPPGRRVGSGPRASPGLGGCCVGCGAGPSPAVKGAEEFAAPSRLDRPFRGPTMPPKEVPRSAEPRWLVMLKGGALARDSPDELL
jgi:hypothetical protein